MCTLDGLEQIELRCAPSLEWVHAVSVARTATGELGGALYTKEVTALTENGQGADEKTDKGRRTRFNPSLEPGHWQSEYEKGHILRLRMRNESRTSWPSTQMAGQRPSMPAVPGSLYRASM